MARKTVKVAELIDWANTYMKLSEQDDGEKRLGMAALVERTLHETGNYKGYNFHGLQVAAGGEVSIPDETRRHYFKARNLT